MDGEISSTTSGSSLPKCFPEFIYSIVNFSLRREGADSCRLTVCVCVCVLLRACPYMILNVWREQNKNPEGNDTASKRSTHYNNESVLK